MNVVVMSGKLIAQSGVFFTLETKEHSGREKHYDSFTIKPNTAIRKIVLERFKVGQKVAVTGKLKTLKEKQVIIFEKFDLI